ncbi:MAG: hypothetical protein V2A67_06315 [Bacteroidota bacterium]
MVTEIGDDRIISIILFIPAYVIIHYIILTKFGFNKESKKDNVYYLLAGILIILVLLIFPVRIGFEYFQNKREKENQELLKKEMVEKRGEIKNWRDDENRTTKIIGELKTKFEFGKIYYQLKLKGLKKSYSELEMMIIQFEDKDEFIINNIEIPFSLSSNITSYESNDSLYLEIKNSELFDSIDYDKIYNWELISKKK